MARAGLTPLQRKAAREKAERDRYATRPQKCRGRFSGESKADFRDYLDTVEAKRKKATHPKRKRE